MCIHLCGFHGHFPCESFVPHLHILSTRTRHLLTKSSSDIPLSTLSYDARSDWHHFYTQSVQDLLICSLLTKLTGSNTNHPLNSALFILTFSVNSDIHIHFHMHISCRWSTNIFLQPTIHRYSPRTNSYSEHHLRHRCTD